MKPSNPILITTTESIPGKRIELIGSVTAATCLSKSMVGDVLANVKNWSVGGELKAYSNLLEAAVANVQMSIRARAHEMDADAVVSFRMVTSSVAAGAAELVGYGTAARVVSSETP